MEQLVVEIAVHHFSSFLLVFVFIGALWVLWAEIQDFIKNLKRLNQEFEEIMKLKPDDPRVEQERRKIARKSQRRK